MDIESYKSKLARRLWKACRISLIPSIVAILIFFVFLYMRQQQLYQGLVLALGLLFSLIIILLYIRYLIGELNRPEGSKPLWEKKNTKESLSETRFVNKVKEIVLDIRKKWKDGVGKNPFTLDEVASYLKVKLEEKSELLSRILDDIVNSGVLVKENDEYWFVS